MGVDWLLRKWETGVAKLISNGDCNSLPGNRYSYYGWKSYFLTTVLSNLTFSRMVPSHGHVIQACMDLAYCIPPLTYTATCPLFRPVSPVLIAAFNARTTQIGHRLAFACTLDTLSIGVCCISEIRIQNIIAKLTVASPSRRYTMKFGWSCSFSSGLRRCSYDSKFAGKGFIAQTDIYKQPTLCHTTFYLDRTSHWSKY
ncbi:hypothetical protein CLF_113067 [Clonorchis sinensis]|uniref:Uncharacterized protein n=1 Tax=Clonorchis sinensis TaxID=79923 RepID=H2KVT3_CLOSI|nr:hypothetical protein CLF_113067 [Clonorchis sinensis]